MSMTMSLVLMLITVTAIILTVSIWLMPLLVMLLVSVVFTSQGKSQCGEQHENCKLEKNAEKPYVKIVFAIFFNGFIKFGAVRSILK